MEQQNENLVTQKQLSFEPLRDRSGLSSAQFSAGEYVIGSGSHCDYSIARDGIAEEHCKIKFDGNKAVLYAIDSRTWINDDSIVETSLRSGDRLSIGPTNFLFQYLLPQDEQTLRSDTPLSNTAQDEDTVLPSDSLPQSLQHAVSQNQIDSSALSELTVAETIPEVAVDSNSDEKVIDELKQSIHQLQNQIAIHKKEQAQLSVEETKTKDKSGTEREVAFVKEIESLRDQVSQFEEREQELQDSLTEKRHAAKKWQVQEHEYLFQQVNSEAKVKALEEELEVVRQQEKSEEVQQEQQLQLQQQIEEMKNSLQENQKQFESEKLTWEEHRRKLSTEIESYQAEVQALNDAQSQSSQDLRETAEETTREQEARTEELLKAQDTIAEERARTATIQQDFDQLQNQLEQVCSKAEQNASQQADIEEQWRQLSAEKETLASAREEVDIEKATFSQARKDIQEIREQIEFDKQQLQQQLDDFERQQHEFEQSQQQSQILETTCEEVAEEIAEASETISSDFEPAENEPAAENVVENNFENTDDITEPEVEESEVNSVEEKTPSLDLDFNKLGDLVNQETTEASKIEEQTENLEESSLDEASQLRSDLAQMFGIDNSSPAEELNSMNKTEQTVEEVVGQVEQIGNQLEEIENVENFAHDEINELPTDSETSEQENSSLEQPVETEAVQEVEVAQAAPASVEDADDPDSIAAYMQGLFARTSGKQEYTEPVIPKKKEPKKQVVQKETAAPIHKTTDSEKAPVTVPAIDDLEPERLQEPPTPIVNVDRKSMAAEIESLRDIANQTARNALCTHAWKQLRFKVLMNTSLTVTCGIIAIILLLAPFWGFESFLVYGLIAMCLSVVTAGELLRSKMMLGRLKTGAKLKSISTEDSEAEPDPTPEEITTEEITTEEITAEEITAEEEGM